MIAPGAKLSVAIFKTSVAEKYYKNWEDSKMKEITINTRVSELDVLKKYAGLFMYKSIINGKSPEQCTLAELNKNIPAWNAESMLNGLKRVSELAERQEVFYRVYNGESYAESMEKKDVGIWYFPTEKPVKKPFFILNAGGAYTSVCSMCEAFPVAARLNEMGYQVFVLNYRVGDDKVIPTALDDVAAAYQYIIGHKEMFHLKSEEYIVCGFSAGASLTSLWGAKSCGYEKYNLRKPRALFLVYPPFTSEYMDEKTRDVFQNTMYGKEASQEFKDLYDIAKVVTEDYPESYLVHCEDDDCIPAQNSIEFNKHLNVKGVKSKLELGKRGGHGFGDGRGTDVEGWLERAVAFQESL